MHTTQELENDFFSTHAFLLVFGYGAAVLTGINKFLTQASPYRGSYWFTYTTKCFPQNVSLSRNDNRNNAHDSLYCVVVLKRDRRKAMGKSATVKSLFAGINGKTVQT